MHLQELGRRELCGLCLKVKGDIEKATWCFNDINNDQKQFVLITVLWAFSLWTRGLEHMSVILIIFLNLRQHDLIREKRESVLQKI